MDLLYRKRSRPVHDGDDTDDICKRRKMIDEIEASLPPDLSKNQRKKQIKEKLKEKMKPEWRQLRKEKEKKRKLEKKKLNPESADTKTHVQMKSMFSSEASQIRIAIDLDYEELMTDKDIKMLIKQCQRCYSQNRRVDKPIQLYLTSVKGKCKERFEQSVSGFKQWELHFKTEGFMSVFNKEEIIFLTAESPNIITELDKDKVYIIGGLVDHNNYKGYCYNQAVKLGISHGRLPITKYISLNSRTVLTVNHVFEILLLYEQHKDWKKALLDAIPQRKIAKS